MARSVALPDSAWKIKVKPKRKAKRKPKPRKPRRKARKPRKRRRISKRRPRPFPLPKPRKLEPIPIKRRGISTRRPPPQPPMRHPSWTAQEELQRLADEFTRKHDLPRVEVIGKPRKGSLGSQLQTRWKTTRRSPVAYPSGTPKIGIGTAGYHIPIVAIQTKGVLFHELGHFKKKWNRFKERGYVLVSEVQRKHITPREKVRREREAWEIARPYLTHPAQHWRRRMAIATYQGQLVYTGDPVHPFTHRSTPMSETEAKRFVSSFKKDLAKAGIKVTEVKIKTELRKGGYLEVEKA